MQNRPLGGDIRKGRPQTRIIPPPISGTHQSWELPNSRATNAGSLQNSVRGGKILSVPMQILQHAELDAEQLRALVAATNPLNVWALFIMQWQH